MNLCSFFLKGQNLGGFCIKGCAIILGCSTTGNRDKQRHTYVSQHPMFDLHWLAPAGLYNAARNCRPF